MKGESDVRSSSDGLQLLSFGGCDGEGSFCDLCRLFACGGVGDGGDADGYRVCRNFFDDACRDSALRVASPGWRKDAAVAGGFYRLNWGGCRGGGFRVGACRWGGRVW